MKSRERSLERFEYGEFVRGFRAACAQRRVDPLEGATSYQVVHIVVSQRRAAYWAEPKKRWWHRQTIWLHSPPYISPTEEEAIWQVFVQASQITAKAMRKAMRLRRMNLPLRELHQSQMSKRQQ